MDVRSFLECLAGGKLREARKLLERHLPLPGILTSVCDHPCENACLRRDLGGSLAISALEQACIRYASPLPRPLLRSPKPQKLAVLGSGLAGLTVAFEISHKGYAVDVYHEGTKDNALLSAFPLLDKAVACTELHDLEKYHVSFRSAYLAPPLLEHCSEEYDAVFADASCCPFIDDRTKVDQATLLLRDNICCGGWLNVTPTGALYPSASSQCGDGRKAGITIQRMLTGVSLSAARENENRADRLHTPLEGIASISRILPSEDGYTEEEARREADRCLRCSCLQCVKECPFLQKYKEFPRIYARKIYNNASVVRGTRTGNVLMNGCALCGQCEVICPEHFSMADLCLQARRDAVERNVMPASAHEFALEDMAQASGQESAFWLKDPSLTEGRHSARVFFPGCQLAASRGEQVLAMYRFLRGAIPDGVDLYSTCCGIPARWAGREELFTKHITDLRELWEKHGRPEILTACSSCMDTLRQAFPDAVITSLWEQLDNLLPEPFPSTAPPVMSIQDPCGARHDIVWQQAVRSLAAKAGIRLEEPSRTGDESACCGYGGLIWNAQPDLAEAMTEKRTKAFSSPVLTSCIMCHDRFASTTESWHLFDILPQTSGSGGLLVKYSPGLSARRAARVELKERILEDFCDISPETVSPSIRLHIPEEVRQAMERRYILLQDVLEAVAGIEQTGAKFLNRENNHFLGSWRPRNVTFWVEYTAGNDGGFLLHDAWCHRMVVAGAVQPAEKIIMEDSVHA